MTRRITLTCLLAAGFLVSASACERSSTSPTATKSSPQYVARGEVLAKQACSAWDANREAQATSLAHQAEQHNLMFSVLYQHMSNGQNLVARDCGHVRDGTFEQHLNDQL